MEKKILGFYVTIPCIDNVGSCTYTGLCKNWADVCPKYFSKYGIPCNCPIPPNTYSIPGGVFEIQAKIPGIATGDFRLTAHFISGSGAHLGCLQLIVNLES